MNILFSILIFGLLVIIHELGHFLLAKKNGITVNEFSVGMGPRLASFVRNGTRYSLKALPFGGSCIMLGEDETVEDEGAFHKKGVWARISVIFAGPLFNFILAFVLALIVVGFVGSDPARITIVEENSPAAMAGLQEGDVITKINRSTVRLGREVNTYFIFNELSEEPLNITYKRNNIVNTVQLTPKLLERYMLGFEYTRDAEYVEVLGVVEGSPFHEVGVQPGDIITEINGTVIGASEELVNYLEVYPLGKQPVRITFMREGEEFAEVVTPRVRREYQIGWDHFFQSEKLSPLNVIRYSAYEVRFYIVNTFRSIVHMARGRVSMDDIAGPVGIVGYMNDVYQETRQYGIGVILINMSSFAIFLSVSLGVFNLLPIPALDGGRLVFLFLEAIRGKPINREKEALVHFVGIAALMLLMVFVLFNDIRRLFG